MTLYTVSEVADALKVQAQTFRQWIRDGKMKAVKIGKAWRVAESELGRFIASN
jgi:excisionase family DNA binding protein